MFTKWMETNEHDLSGRHLTYIQFPKMFVWDNKTKNWSKRKQGTCIGRLVTIHPSAGPKYFLRMMINHQRGCTSFEDIRTVGGVTYKTYKESCYALGLLDGDKEWHEVMAESSQWAYACQLRELFVLILIYCEVVDPLKLWNNCWRSLSEDILHMQRRRLGFEELNLQDKEIQQYVLIELQKLLNQSDKSLTDYPHMPVPEKKHSQQCQKLIAIRGKELQRRRGERKTFGVICNTEFRSAIYLQRSNGFSQQLQRKVILPQWSMRHRKDLCLQNSDFKTTF
ncbi:hypothetical protein V5N11_012169 [Cardamine amara subsp. amara]|uniref:Uncharacterized protein n=1 Tax=Cardamine amara subsp. amara TaxID=228776 RepID=A0ABD0Z451_CARAN